MRRRHDNATRFVERAIAEYERATSLYAGYGHHCAAAALIELAYKQGDISDVEHFDYYQRLGRLAERAKGAA